MRSWTLSSARDAVARLKLSDRNAELADYWLSLWSGDYPPTRAKFNPRRVTRLIPSIAIFSVSTAQTVYCRLAGTNIKLATGLDLTGKDLIAITPEHDRTEQLRRCKEIVEGSVAVAHRAFKRGPDFHESFLTELSLPFADVADDGAGQFLFFVDWRPEGDEHLLTIFPRATLEVPTRFKSEKLLSA